MPIQRKTKGNANIQRGNTIQDKKYPTRKLLKSRHLAGYQPDFAKAVLREPAYSIAEAKEILENVMKAGR